MLFFCFCAFYGITACQGPKEVGTVKVDPSLMPFSKLSEYNFLKGNLKSLTPNDGVLSYDLNTPLFSDYAFKARFVWMPDSVQATVAKDGQIVFPKNTVLIKNFYYPADFRFPNKNWTLIETRLLYKTGNKWDTYTYVWNKAQTEATLNLIGGLQKVRWKDQLGETQEVEYLIPNKNQCKSCHNISNQIEPIGPKLQNLDRDLVYGEVKLNQLKKWQEMGLLRLDPDQPNYPAMAKWDDQQSGDLESRALAYLNVNCGHCHQPEGPAHTTGLYLTYDQTNRGQLGICKSPVAAGKGSGDRLYGIHPGQADSSILVFRMESNDPGIMMPELGRGIKHKEGIALIRAWIDHMEGTCKEGLQINN